MFAYCQNNPANYFDPSGNAAVVVCHADEITPFGGGLGFLGFGGGGGVGYAAAAVSSAIGPVQRNADYINNSSEGVL